MNNDRIIVPLDVPNLKDAIDLVNRLPQVTFWKVGLELFVSAGSDILQFLRDRNCFSVSWSRIVWLSSY